MATYIKTLKEDNGDITYPQTKAEGVLLNNGSDLETELSQYVTAEEIGSTAAVTPAITTAMIADDAVTTAKIADDAVTASKVDWGTVGGFSAVWTGSYAVSTSAARVWEIDITGAETGGKYVALATANAGGSDTQTGFFINLHHSTQSSSYTGIVSVWGKMSTNVLVFTKVAGVDEVVLQAYKDNSSSVILYSMTLTVWRIG